MRTTAVAAAAPSAECPGDDGRRGHHDEADAEQRDDQSAVAQRLGDLRGRQAQAHGGMLPTTNTSIATCVTTSIVSESISDSSRRGRANLFRGAGDLRTRVLRGARRGAGRPLSRRRCPHRGSRRPRSPAHEGRAGKRGPGTGAAVDDHATVRVERGHVSRAGRIGRRLEQPSRHLDGAGDVVLPLGGLRMSRTVADPASISARASAGVTCPMRALASMTIWIAVFAMAVSLSRPHAGRDIDTSGRV